MTEIFLTIFFISVLLFFLGSGIWVALSMIGVSAIGMMLFTAVNAVKLILFKYLINKLNNFINLKRGKKKDLIC